MILIIIAILLFVALLIWLWRGPISNSANSLQAGGSSQIESYMLVLILVVVLVGSVYMIIQVI